MYKTQARLINYDTTTNLNTSIPQMIAQRTRQTIKSVAVHQICKIKLKTSMHIKTIFFCAYQVWYAYKEKRLERCTEKIWSSV